MGRRRHQNIPLNYDKVCNLRRDSNPSQPYTNTVPFRTLNWGSCVGLLHSPTQMIHTNTARTLATTMATHMQTNRQIANHYMQSCQHWPIKSSRKMHSSTLTTTGIQSISKVLEYSYTWSCRLKDIRNKISKEPKNQYSQRSSRRTGRNMSFLLLWEVLLRIQT